MLDCLTASAQALAPQKRFESRDGEKTSMLDTATDVVVVGGGNAGLCAALSARDTGANVIVLETATKSDRGGNSAYTAGAMRVAYDGVDDLKELMDISDDMVAKSDFGQYSAGDFLDDIATVTDYRCDPDLTATLVDDSFDTLRWMRSQGVRFAPTYGRQAFEVEGRFVFWGGVAVEVVGGGPGLVDYLHTACERQGVEVRYENRATALVADDSGVTGVRVTSPEGSYVIDSRSIVLAAGGFESNSEWRARYLGPGWDLAKVRGTRHNNGDGIRMALDIGAMPFGHWSGCHAVGWDRNAPDFGTLAVGDGFQKHSYPLGIMVNARGDRFVDEGADFRNYTYAKYGREVLAQPGQFAWQVFDAKTQDMLRDEYRIREVTRVRADTLQDLAKKMDGVDPGGFLSTVEEYNAAVMTDVPFDPNVKDGRGTRGLTVPKSNWANPIDEPPFEAYGITCGVTFTFGGLRISEEAEVKDVAGRPIPGLFACGELVGGIFYFNYPGGSGLTAGAVYGRRAGAGAGHRALLDQEAV